MVKSAASAADSAISANGTANGPHIDANEKPSKDKKKLFGKRNKDKAQPPNGNCEVAESAYSVGATTPETSGDQEIEDFNYPTAVAMCGKEVCHVSTGSLVALAVEAIGCLVLIAHGAYAWTLPKHQYEVDEPATEALLKIIKPAEMACSVIFDFVGPGLMLVSVIIAVVAVKMEMLKLLIPHAVMQLVFTLGLIVQCFIIVVTPMEYHAELINHARVFDNYIPGYVLPYHKLKLFGICFAIMCMFGAAVLCMVWFIQILKWYFFYLYNKQNPGAGKGQSRNRVHPVNGQLDGGPHVLSAVDLQAPKVENTRNKAIQKEQRNHFNNVVNNSVNEAIEQKQDNHLNKELTPDTDNARVPIDDEEEVASNGSKDAVIEKLDDAVTKIVLDPQDSQPSTPVNKRHMENGAVKRRPAASQKEKQDAEDE